MMNQQYSNYSFLKFAEQILDSAPNGSVARYALSELIGFMHARAVEYVDSEVLRQWIAAMVLSGKKLSTCKRYFAKAHSIYCDWNRSESDPFVEVDGLFDGLADNLRGEAEHNLSLIKRLTGKSERADVNMLVAIFFYLLFNPQVSTADVVNLTFDNSPRYCPQIEEIVSSQDSSHGRKYVFSLKQGKSRPVEIVKTLTRELYSLLMSVGMTFSNGFSRDSITAIWIAAALKKGVAVSDIKSCVGSIPDEYSVLSIVDAKALYAAERERIICDVADSVNNNAKRWFVMKLRHGVDVKDIETRIQASGQGSAGNILLFYPTRTEISKEGKKRVVKEVPYLRDILFFKTRRSRVKSLFANIGDLAWCFRTANSPESDYSVVSHSQMANFQRYVGQFTPDIKIELVDDEKPLEKGRRVKVVGGIMAGYEGEILDVEGEPGKRIFFLSLTNSQRAKWTAYVDDVFIEPAE